MCFSKPNIPQPKPAPSPPDRNQATFAAVNEQRAARAGAASRQSTLLTRLTDAEVAGAATPKKLLGE